MTDSDIEIDDWESISEVSEQEFMAEINAFERAGGAIAGNLTNIEKLAMNPLERFRYNLRNKMIGLNGLKENKIFNDDIINYLDEMAINLENIEKKNVVAYILGFHSIKEKKIDIKKFNFITLEILPFLDNNDITPPDIIRYGRLWENLLS